MPPLERRVEALEALEARQPERMGRIYLWAPDYQTREQALTDAGLADYDGLTTAIRLVGVKPPERPARV